MSVRVGIGLGGATAVDVRGSTFLALVDRLEALGYDSVWLSDSATLPGPAPLTALAAIAARTTRLKLGTGVLVPAARNPALLAKELATVDAISHGRLLPAFGLGIDVEPESSAIGVPRSERAARTEESIEILRLLWSGERVTYDGRFTTLRDVELSPPPLRPRLDIWLAGSSPAALRRTGRLADGWLGSFVSPDELSDCVRRIVEAAADADREIDDDHYGTTLFAAPARDELPDRLLRLATRRPELALDDHVAVGTDALRELLERFVAAGASKFVVVPVARELEDWLEELRVDAIAPFEKTEVPTSTRTGGDDDQP
jgi:probable F420-dependent oxidoreductase